MSDGACCFYCKKYQCECPRLDPMWGTSAPIVSDLDRFTAAMNGLWSVVRYELDGDKLRVVYRSQVNPLIEWSHTPFNDFNEIPKVGTVGRIGFAVEQEEPKP